MSNLKLSNAYKTFFQFAEQTGSELIIIAPFIKLKTLKKIIDRTRPSVKIIVIARWRIEDLVIGISDIELYKYLKNLNHKFLINDRIHLKVCLSDKKELILGSANITDSGLGLSKINNIEAVTINSIDPEDLAEVLKIVKTSMTVDDQLFDKIYSQFKKFKMLRNSYIANRIKFEKFDKKIFLRSKSNIIVNDFPFTFSPSSFIEKYKNKTESLELKHDMELFGIKFGLPILDVQKQLKLSFLRCDAFEWERSSIQKETLFGKYSEMLHTALIDDPRPYRKVVKNLVNNMFNWTEGFSDEFVIKRYAHTKSINKKLF